VKYGRLTPRRELQRSTSSWASSIALELHARIRGVPELAPSTSGARFCSNCDRTRASNGSLAGTSIPRSSPAPASARVASSATATALIIGTHSLPVATRPGSQLAQALSAIAVPRHTAATAPISTPVVASPSKGRECDAGSVDAVSARRPPRRSDQDPKHHAEAGASEPSSSSPLESGLRNAFGRPSRNDVLPIRCARRVSCSALLAAPDRVAQYLAIAGGRRRCLTPRCATYTEFRPAPSPTMAGTSPGNGCVYQPRRSTSADQLSVAGSAGATGDMGRRSRSSRGKPPGQPPRPASIRSDDRRDQHLRKADPASGYGERLRGPPQPVRLLPLAPRLGIAQKRRAARPSRRCARGTPNFSFISRTRDTGEQARRARGQVGPGQADKFSRPGCPRSRLTCYNGLAS